MVKIYLRMSWERDFLSKVCPTKLVHKSNFCEWLPTKNSNFLFLKSSFTRWLLVTHSSYLEGSLTSKNTASDEIKPNIDLHHYLKCFCVLDIKLEFYVLPLGMLWKKFLQTPPFPFLKFECFEIYNALKKREGGGVACMQSTGFLFH
jgi:hypothetical protein